MSVDKFGRSSHPEHYHERQPQFTEDSLLSFTAEGNIDAANKRICNVQEPTQNNDVANKKYVIDVKSRLKNDFSVAFNASLDNVDRTIKQAIQHTDDSVKDLRKYNESITDDMTVKISDLDKKIGEVKQGANISVEKLQQSIEKTIKDLSQEISNVNTALTVNTFNLETMLKSQNDLKSKLDQFMKNIVQAP